MKRRLFIRSLGASIIALPFVGFLIPKKESPITLSSEEIILFGGSYDVNGNHLTLPVGVYRMTTTTSGTIIELIEEHKNV